MTIRQLNEEQRNELRDTIYGEYMHGRCECVDLKNAKLTKNDMRYIACGVGYITDEILEKVFKGIDFTDDDFFCTSNK